MAAVVILEPSNYNVKALELYASLGNVCARSLTPEELDRELADARVLVVRLAHKIDAEFLAKAPKLKIVASPTTGLDHIDLAACEARGIKIVSLKGWHEVTEKIYATSELTIGLMLALLRHIPAARAHVVSGGWNRDHFIGNEISRKTVGLIGCGRLGSRVGEILQSMGAFVVAFDPHQPDAKIPKGIKRLSKMEDLLSSSDIVSVHAALTSETTGLIGNEQFNLMKPGSFFINTSRGQIVDEAALLKVLESGRLAGAALDVMDKEAADSLFLIDNPLRAYASSHNNLILTPHIGGATRESMGLTEVAIAEAVVKAYQDVA